MLLYYYNFKFFLIITSNKNNLKHFSFEFLIVGSS